MNYLFEKGYLFGALLFFVACTERSIISDGSFSKIELLDSIEIKMPLEYLSLTKWTSYNFQDQNYLVEYGVYRNDGLIIHRIDFERQEYLSPIKIPREGPNGFNSNDASIYFEDVNSIFVFPVGSREFYKYDSLGNRISQFNYDTNDNTRFFNTGYYTTAIKTENKLVIPTINDTRFDDAAYFRKVFPVSQIDLSTGKFVGSIGYPNTLNGEIFPSNQVGANIAMYQSNKVLINYCFSDSLYLYDLENGRMVSKYCGLKGWKQPQPLKAQPDRLESLTYQAVELNYQDVFVHSGRIYRLVSHVKDDSYRGLSFIEILERDLRGLTLIELDVKTDEIKYFTVPYTKYFLFDKSKLYVGGVSMREEIGDSYRTFYVYSLEGSR